MEFLHLLRRLWRRRILLGAGVLVAAATLVASGGTSPVTAQGGLASTSVALDTPRSQLVAAAPVGADTLAWRASLLAHLMATNASRMELAGRARCKAGSSRSGRSDPYPAARPDGYG